MGASFRLPSASRAARAIGLTGFTLCAIFLSHVEAGGLRDTIKDLYGGDGILLAPTPGPFPTHAPHFQAASLQGLDALNNALAPNLNNLAFNSTVTGFTFDLERGVPVRTTESLGPLLAERATTLGAKKLNLVFTYVRLNFSKFEGDDTGNLKLTLQHDDVNGDGVLATTGPLSFESDEILVNIDLDLHQDIFALIGTYGLTRYWDVGIVVPVVHTYIRAQASATIIRNSPVSAAVHNFDTAPGSDQPQDTRSGDAIGLGDVILRTKYNFLRDHSHLPDMAIRGDVKTGSGDVEDLLGTGDTRVQGLFIASQTWGAVTPHVNLGYQLSDVSSEQNNMRYIAGADVAPHPRVAFALDVIGSWEHAGNDIGDHIVDLAPQVKWNPFDTFVVDSFFLIPMNKDSGLRTDVTWGLGAEYLF